ncbi:hypothetical protein GCM10025867_12940 [Frondihabitans sucicola]|uniref:Uncharacterized protein n=1 Tax=Frondihabitans sucicola TaxID=1268041 RepID=A0ABN6XY37_9MICO|nr:hypothetical protein [Frondihabitans sucicola]BDZ49053.1 hypothetical protein GCM10025867_12940 [Frondihabitans sucicola]
MSDPLYDPQTPRPVYSLDDADGAEAAGGWSPAPVGSRRWLREQEPSSPLSPGIEAFHEVIVPASAAALDNPTAYDLAAAPESPQVFDLPAPTAAQVFDLPAPTAAPAWPASSFPEPQSWSAPAPTSSAPAVFDLDAPAPTLPFVPTPAHVATASAPTAEFAPGAPRPASS